MAISTRQIKSKADSKSRIIRLGLLTYIVLTASFCYIMILYGLQWAPPFAFGGLRTMVGGLTILIISWLTGRAFVPEKRLWKWIPWVALTATTFTFGSMFLSPQFAGAGLASILGNAQPVFIAVVAWFLLGERLSRIQLLSLFLGLGGVIAIVSPSFGPQSNDLFTGTLIALLTSASAAIGTVMVRFIKLGNSLLVFTGWQLLLGGATLVFVSAILGEQGIEWNWTFTRILLFLGIFNSAIVTCAWFYLLQQERAGKLGIYLFLTPVLGTLWAFLFLDERLSITSIVGGSLVLAAVLSQEFEGIVRSQRLNR